MRKSAKALGEGRQNSMATILLVDDSTTIRQELRHDLENEGYHVLEAIDGEDGLRQVEKEHIDLIITDLNMPNMNGIVMCRHLFYKGSKAPVFMMTTQTSQELKVEAKQYGVKAWIVKPYDKEAIINGINMMLSS